MPNMNVPMALVYDFDGTLAPGNLQENSFIPDIGMDKQDLAMLTDGQFRPTGECRSAARGYTTGGRKCAQYVTKNAQRAPCDRPCTGFYCELHGGNPPPPRRAKVESPFIGDVGDVAMPTWD